MIDAPTIVLAAGGTAGHVYPAIAVADELRGLGVDVVFAGTSHGIESKIVPHYGYPLRLLPAHPFERQPVSGKVRAVASAAFGWIESRAFLREIGADAVVGFGGYASVAPLLAARSLHIRTAIHEANWELGRANRFLASRVDRIYTAHGAVTAHPHRVVGMPVRRQILELRRNVVPLFAPSVLVMTGTEPSAFMATRVPDVLGDIVKRGVPLRVVHQTADAEGEAIASRYRSATIQATVASFFDDIERIYARIDLVIARAGASSVAELAACGLPALLIPHPGAAGDHQTGNARLYERMGGVHWINERDWNARAVLEWLLPLLQRDARLSAASDAIRRIAAPHAAAAMAADLMAMIDYQASNEPITSLRSQAAAQRDAADSARSARAEESATQAIPTGAETHSAERTEKRARPSSPPPPTCS